MRLYSESVGNDGLHGPLFVDSMTVADGGDILSAPTGYESTKTFKNSLNSKDGVKRYFDPVQVIFGCTVNEPSQFKTQLVNGIMGLPAVSNTYLTIPNIFD
jgi:hypothetical protein